MGKVKHKHSHAHLLFSNLLFVEQPQFLSKRNDNMAPPVHSSTSDDNTLEELITVSKLCSFSFFFLTPHQMKRCYHRISRYQQMPWQVQQYPSGGLADVSTPVQFARRRTKYSHSCTLKDIGTKRLRQHLWLLKTANIESLGKHSSSKN